jgi:phage/plasmid-associated DNA primase
MALLGKRMSVYSEGETADKIEMNTAGLKQVSGEDALCGRQLYGNQLTFTPYTKLHMLTNFTPPLNAEHAIKQRLRYIFLDSEFVDNPDVKNKKQFKKDKSFTDLLETVYLSEIFTWIIKGAQEFYKTMTIEMSKEFKERTEIILSNEDSIKTFIDRKLKFTDVHEDYLNKTPLVEAYQNFCHDNSQRCQQRSSLFNRLEHLGRKTHTLNGYDIFRGIIFVDNDPFENDNLKELDHGLSNDIDYEELYNKQLKEIADLKEQLKELTKPQIISKVKTTKKATK